MTTTAAPPFAGFQPEAIAFLADLAEHNERTWFQPRKGEFERLVRAPMEALVAELAERFASRSIPLFADPKHSIFRIYRDTRFSKDKSPYKTRLGASFPWTGRIGGPADGADIDAETTHGNGGYFNFAPGDMYIGGGMWLPERPRLEAFRRAIVEHPERVEAALEDPGVLATFGAVHPHGQLKRVPPGWPADHPRADWLRFKDVVFGRRLSDEEVMSPALPDILAGDFETALPVFRFLATLDG